MPYPAVICDRHRKQYRPRWVTINPDGSTKLLKHWCADNGYTYQNVLNELKRQAKLNPELIDLRLAISAIMLRGSGSRYYSRPSSAARREKVEARKARRRVDPNVTLVPDYSQYPELRVTGLNFESTPTLTSTGRKAVHYFVPCEGGRYRLHTWCRYTGVPYSMVLLRIKRLGAGISLVLDPPKRPSGPQPE